jgi:uncharacterized protein (DUF433 family)
MERTIGTAPRASAVSSPRASVARRHARYRLDRASLLPAMVARPADQPIDEDAHNALADAIREELAPVGPIEELLVSGIVAAARGVRQNPCDDRSERALHRGLRMLLRLRAAHHAQEVEHSPGGTFAGAPQSEADSIPRRDRLTFDPTVSDSSPVVRGTWITVGQVVTRIVDGWSWSDILRAHPELWEDDIRACLSFTVEDEGSR